MPPLARGPLIPEFGYSLSDGSLAIWQPPPRGGLVGSWSWQGDPSCIAKALVERINDHVAAVLRLTLPHPKDK